MNVNEENGRSTRKENRNLLIECDLAVAPVRVRSSTGGVWGCIGTTSLSLPAGEYRVDCNLKDYYRRERIVLNEGKKRLGISKQVRVPADEAVLASVSQPRVIPFHEMQTGAAPEKELLQSNWEVQGLQQLEDRLRLQVSVPSGNRFAVEVDVLETGQRMSVLLPRARGDFSPGMAIEYASDGRARGDGDAVSKSGKHRVGVRVRFAEDLLDVAAECLASADVWSLCQLIETGSLFEYGLDSDSDIGRTIIMQSGLCCLSSGAGLSRASVNRIREGVIKLIEGGGIKPADVALALCALELRDGWSKSAFERLMQACSCGVPTTAFGLRLLVEIGMQFDAFTRHVRRGPFSPSASEQRVVSDAVNRLHTWISPHTESCVFPVRQSRIDADGAYSAVVAPEVLKPYVASRGGPRLLRGTVTSSRMQKTRRVDVVRRVRHPKYGKLINRRTVCHVHDEWEHSHEGDTVLIEECRPLSKTKRWRLVRVLDRPDPLKVQQDYQRSTGE